MALQRLEGNLGLAQMTLSTGGRCRQRDRYWEANLTKSHTGGRARHTTAVIKNKETLVTCGPGASHLLGRAELGPGRVGFGAGVRNCIVIWGGGAGRAWGEGLEGCPRAGSSTYLNQSVCWGWGPPVLSVFSARSLLLARRGIRLWSGGSALLVTH